MPHFSMITQNVDGLHALAGTRNVIELHGNIRLTRCIRCGAVEEYRSFESALPYCRCSGLLRPAVVWFGEALPPGVFERAEAEAADADVFLVAGTSAVVYPAAGLVDIAKAAGAFVVEINSDRTGVTSTCDVSVRAKAGEFLPLVADALDATRRHLP